MQPRDHPGVLVPPPLLYAAGFVLVLVLDRAWPLPIASSPAIGWLGMLLLSLGVTLNVWGAYCMIKSKTPINPYRSVTGIVTSGAFRVSRNPLYLGLHGMFIGLALLLNSVWGLFVAVPLFVIIHYGVIVREERHLDAKFGEAYRLYCAMVGRYF